jgi:uncharacterized damage-inducible protein DinB
MSRKPREPDKTTLAGAERWAGYLDWLREDLIEGIQALPPAEQRVSRVPSGWAPVELLSHLLHMEQRWFIWGFLGEQVSDPWGDWNVADPSTGAADARWFVSESVTVEELADRLRLIGERTESILRTHALDAHATLGGRFTDNPPTLEWICFHVLTEYARHAGQFDVVAETSAAVR